MRREPSEASFYISPSPAVVAAIWDSPLHGPEAACERWFAFCPRTLAELASLGRAVHGTAPRTPLTMAQAAAVETAYVLGSQAAACGAAALSHACLVELAARRGLKLPSTTPELRARHTRDGNLAKRQDVAGDEARERIEARRAHAAAVYGVVRISLARVPQPPTGRYRYPRLDGDLAAALVDFPEAATAAVFPTVRLPPEQIALTRAA